METEETFELKTEALFAYEPEGYIYDPDTGIGDPTTTTTTTFPSMVCPSRGCPTG